MRRIHGDRVRDHQVVETIVETVIADPGDAKQSIIGRGREPPRIGDELIVEIEQRWLSGAVVRQHLVRTLAQGIEEQDRALPQVTLISKEVGYQLGGAGLIDLLLRRLALPHIEPNQSRMAHIVIYMC